MAFFLAIDAEMYRSRPTQIAAPFRNSKKMHPLPTPSKCAHNVNRPTDTALTDTAQDRQNVVSDAIQIYTETNADSLNC